MGVWTLAATLAASAFGCAADDGVAPLEPPRHLVLITIDTLRADHVSSYGHPISTTPFVDSLAAEGVLFERAYAQSATTKPSHSSIFTALYPLQHGVQNNGLVLDGEFVTLAEMLAEQGYRTGAFVSTDAPLGGNVRQGFEKWDQYEADLDVEGGRKQYRQAEQTVDRALEWARSLDGSAPVFLWVHLYDPHRPIQPPDDRVMDVRRMVQELGEDAYRSELVSRGVPGNDKTVEDSILYDAEILYSDVQLRRLHDGLGAAGWHDDTLWVVTSDHGQGLGAHDWYGHSKQIYNAQLWVPLVFWFGPGGEATRIGDRIVEHVDLLPTLAEIVGFDVSQILPVQGRSLAPMLRGERVRDPKWFAFGERSRYVDAGERQQERGNYEEGFRYAVQDLEFKYLLFSEGDDEFYDLAGDPYETRNLIDAPEYADRREQMREVLTEMIETIASGRQAESVPQEDMERLRALGYIQ